MPTKKINFDVLSFIQTLNLSSFSIAYLNKMYLSHDACSHSNVKTSKQYLYRKINELVKAGFLNCVKKSGTNALEYRLSIESPTEIVGSISKRDKHTLSDIEVCNVLKEKIKHSKLALLTSIGETEAYKECVEEMPIIQNKVQARYNVARDNTSKLLGKVSAYESLLSLFASNYTNDKS